MNHMERATEALRHAEGAREHLDTLYRLRPEDRPQAHVAAAHEDQRFALAVAKVHAQLAVAEQLELLVGFLAVQGKPLGVTL